MRKALLALSVAAVVTAFGTTGFAAQTTSKSKATPAAATTAAAKAQSATGKIVSFDDASKTLVLSTSKGDEKFVLGSSARLQEGAKTIAAADLSGLTGHQAKVRYTASGADRSAESVMVSGDAGAKARK